MSFMADFYSISRVSRSHDLLGVDLQKPEPRLRWLYDWTRKPNLNENWGGFWVCSFPLLAMRFSESVGTLKERHLSVWVSMCKSVSSRQLSPGFVLKKDFKWCRLSLVSSGFSLRCLSKEKVCSRRLSSVLHRAPIRRLWLWVEHVFKCELHCLCCSNQSWQLWLMRKAWQACRFIPMSCAVLRYHIWPVDGDGYLLGLCFGRCGLGVQSFCLVLSGVLPLTCFLHTLFSS